MREIRLVLALALIPLLAGACARQSAQVLSPRERSLVALDLAHTRRAGIGVRFRPSPLSAAVTMGAPVGSLRCLPGRRPSYAAHLELFAQQREIVVPGAIGVSAPRFEGPLVVGGRCVYPVQTVDPTGVIRVARGAAHPAPRLGEVFHVWGQRLGSYRLGAFTGRVSAFVDGRRWFGDPRLIPLRRHAQIVLEIGGFVAPHTTYGFPPGL